jgi:ribonuclease Z
MFNAEIKSKIGEDICILVKPDNHPWNYICECGDASGLTVKETHNANAVFISHTHIDHFVAFDNVVRHQIGIQRKVIICGPKGIAQQVQSKII